MADGSIHLAVFGYNDLTEFAIYMYKYNNAISSLMTLPGYRSALILHETKRAAPDRIRHRRHR
jgi:hypothetical protein